MTNIVRVLSLFVPFATAEGDKEKHETTYTAYELRLFEKKNYVDIYYTLLHNGA